MQTEFSIAADLPITASLYGWVDHTTRYYANELTYVNDFIDYVSGKYGISFQPHLTMEYFKPVRFTGYRAFRMGLGLDYHRIAGVFNGGKQRECKLTNQLFKANLIWFSRNNLQLFTPVGYSMLSFNPYEGDAVPTDSDIVKNNRWAWGLGAKLTFNISKSMSIELQYENLSNFYRTELDDFLGNYRYGANLSSLKFNYKSFYVFATSIVSDYTLNFNDKYSGSLNAFHINYAGLGYTFRRKK